MKNRRSGKVHRKIVKAKYKKSGRLPLHRFYDEINLETLEELGEKNDTQITISND